jgi:5'(3')-deoxyribonucleotidase
LGGGEMICFLDMDGVLVDFREGVCEIFLEDPSNNWEFWDEWKGVTFENINKVCDIPFWASLSWTKEGKQILEMVEAIFDDVYLLTTPMPNPGSATGKELWIEKHIQRYKNRMIITRASKGLFAGSDRVLIDDKNQNIHDFVDAGGQGILIPRPWNELHNWSDIVLEVLENSLENFR